MMYPYMILDDETEIIHSHLIETGERGEDKRVEVHFERPTENGFDTARCSLPSYEWIKRDGFTNGEIYKFEHFLQNHAHLLYKYAESGGVQVA